MATRQNPRDPLGTGAVTYDPDKVGRMIHFGTTFPPKPPLPEPAQERTDPTS